ncbi:MAG: NAD/NADP octopine/nopaline dehydrogenase family protein [Microcoleus sp.]
MTNNIYVRLLIAKTKTLYSTGAIAPGTHAIAECSTNLATLVEKNGGTLPRKVIIGCRGNDVEDLAIRFAPFVEAETSILLICSGRFAGLIFLKTLLRLGVKQNRLPAVADFHVSPFVSRGNSNDQVNIIALKNEVNIAAQTPRMTEQILQDFQGTFRNISVVKSSLELNLQKCDEIVHIPLILTGWINLEAKEGHNIYRTATHNTAEMVVRLDLERLAVGKALGFELWDICTDYQKIYGTSGSSLLEHFRQVPAYDTATIQNSQHRFLFEDVPFSAEPLQSLARLAQVKTPLLDACITFSRSLVDLSPAWTFSAEDLDILRETSEVLKTTANAEKIAEKSEV